MRARLLGLFLLLATIASFGAIAASCAGYWEDQIDWPPIANKEPPEAQSPDWKTEGIHILSAFELLTDLGRQQAFEIDRLLAESDLVAGCFSLDWVAEEWTRQYVADFRSQKNVSIPIFSIDDAGMRGLFQGYDSSKLRPFPHTFLVDANGSIHRIFVGVQSSKTLLEAIAEAKDVWNEIEPVSTTSEPNLIRDGGFEDWSDPVTPGTWGVYQPGKGTVLAATGTGWLASHSLEIRSSTAMEYQIAYQIIPHKDLLGRNVEFSALAQSNALSAPKAVLAIPHPTLEEGEGFVPRSPVVTTSGRGIPLRIVGDLEFERGHNQWRRMSTRVQIPPEARALVVLFYLDNPRAVGGAARFDEATLHPVP